MRRLILIAALTVLAAGPALAQDAPADPGQDRGMAEKRPNLRDAVTAPLDDLNLKHIDIPDVLTRATAGPYDMEGLTRCEAIAGEVGRLNEALGPDLDEPPPPDRRTRGQKVKQAAGDAAVGAIGDKTRSLLPFRGWIRKLTGAERRDKRVAAAIQAGKIRRGYLKGAGMRMNCAPPAAPSWFVPKGETPGKGNGGGGFLAWLGGVWAAIVGWVKGLFG
ncbi:hypothetical protein QO010_001153 [Caulobacter ginsengisoli]|uniref:Uncharacterized protein n=1 Tax=Caulobacter ginsengisoli TaxID=400775 RepID=A0ABU0IR03_9CAUL|nr:hypothetical protein [Caulobacter ginsengisoli]MDQ0463382.1 hypothetical protein [Caulobacter ginsengisoli]